MIVKLLTEHPLEFQSLKGGCRGSTESKLVKMSNCWKSHAAAHLKYLIKVSRCQSNLQVVSPDQKDNTTQHNFSFKFNF